ncbi:extracellular solute-binding protein [Bifidobacterium biavatii]|uniref:Family 1 extracellular solute-binding protein n=1 Tax=Bifidobacterium biavatii DSM 23969 TaxID=1437608 RepID=A0A086ZMX3_9BIFI|nr:extracellular solute-binding protein [Bifidobacterium biavatii]KFI47873.1 family 1 extracellular solute-binding protein [Bifidobacterium biavatii DSM 23969]
MDKGVAKKVLAGVAAAGAASMLLTTLSACGQSTASNKTTSDGKPIVTILVVQNTNQISIKEMQWAKDIAKEAGVQIEWKPTLDTAWGQQKNASLAAGDIADLNIRAYNPDDTAQNTGAFEDLSKDMDKLPNVKAFFDAKPTAKKFVESDGAIRVLPSDRGKAFAASGQHMLINKTWLDKLGLKAPTTWSELTKVLEAFKTQDPNGNGKADEIPINLRALPTDTLAGWWSPFLFLNSTGIATHYNSGPSQQGIYVKDGKVGNVMQTDEFRQVLNYLASLTKSGLAPKDWVTTDKYDSRNQVGGDTAQVGVVFGWDQTAFGGYDSDLYKQYVAIPVPSADGVSADKTVWDASGISGANEFEDYHMSMSANAANKDACLKLINLFYSEKYSVQQLWGSFDTYLKKTGDHSYEITDAFHKAQDEGKSPTLEDRLAGWIPDDVTVKGDRGADSVSAVDKPYAEQYANLGEGDSAVKNYMPIYVRLSPDDQTTVANNNSSIFTTVLPVIAKMAQTGADDASWNTLQNDLKSLNLQQNIDIWQKAYDKATK